MGDVFAVVATDTDCSHAVEVAIAVAYCIKIENVEKACIGHCGVPRNFGDVALLNASIL
ncbi:TPA: hypothetical protein UM350_004408 [Stenotrophomonas maltophilia]|uniref:hypothetical protein n=1 Tax=Stenotrophomonas maltophilia TaxID=40324 RepID=UPI0013042706|nr:hypothetical protein [Stenotrophomonas maltophilia]MBN5120378.1 hypothetical protein [Stenotrophomonas maltophilia]MBO3002047.1 hypothetical protein [Stenotrophomonas maltophilia]MBP1382072.1 hypothetical protein [Stenotrophomonas maltophilia]MBP1387093.1 hypothetical protein [Stenotrophomonas maltophilia]HDS0943710.1 hypothetical protein [Stenotrophomonas maltophilia]